jgi:aquaporin Z
MGSLNDRDPISQAVVEFIGAFTLIFLGAGAIIMTGGENLVAIALAHGLAIAIMIAAAGHISGGFFNPALVIGVTITGRMTPQRMGIYLAAQFAGAIVAALALRTIFKPSQYDPVELGTPMVGANYEVGAALLIEIIMTFFLMFVVYGAAVDSKGANIIAPLAIGLTITADIFAGGAVSGAAMNPARWFGPALVQGFWDDGWIYIVGPVAGAALAALLYSYLLLDRTPMLTPRRTPPSEEGETTIHTGERERVPARRRRRR